MNIPFKYWHLILHVILFIIPCNCTIYPKPCTLDNMLILHCEWNKQYRSPTPLAPLIGGPWINHNVDIYSNHWPHPWWSLIIVVPTNVCKMGNFITNHVSCHTSELTWMILATVPHWGGPWLNYLQLHHWTHKNQGCTFYIKFTLNNIHGYRVNDPLLGGINQQYSE